MIGDGVMSSSSSESSESSSDEPPIFHIDVRIHMIHQFDDFILSFFHFVCVCVCVVLR